MEGRSAVCAPVSPLLALRHVRPTMPLPLSTQWLRGLGGAVSRPFGPPSSRRTPAHRRYDGTMAICRASCAETTICPPACTCCSVLCRYSLTASLSRCRYVDSVSLSVVGVGPRSVRPAASRRRYPVANRRLHVRWLRSAGALSGSGTASGTPEARSPAPESPAGRLPAGW